MLRSSENVLILDEPTAALGVKQSGVVLTYITAAPDAGFGVVLITHNPHRYRVNCAERARNSRHNSASIHLSDTVAQRANAAYVASRRHNGSHGHRSRTDRAHAGLAGPIVRGLARTSQPADAALALARTRGHPSPSEDPGIAQAALTSARPQKALRCLTAI